MTSAKEMLELDFEQYRKQHFGAYSAYPVDAFTYFAAGFEAALRGCAAESAEPGGLRPLIWDNGKQRYGTIPEFIEQLRTYADLADREFGHCSTFKAYLGERISVAADMLGALYAAPQPAVPADVREALKPFAEAAREFTSAIGPDGIDDGVAVVATMHGTRREAILSTTDFSRAAKVFAQRVVNQINSAIAQEAK